MPKIRTILLLILVAGLLWFVYADDYKQDGASGVWDEMKQDVHDIRNSESVDTLITYIGHSIEYVAGFISDQFEGAEESPSVPSPELAEPTEQSFSIHNIEVTDEKKDVESVLGEPARVTPNEYHTEWHTYHDHYQNFVMVAFNNNDQVTGLYTNQDLLRSKGGITLDNTKQEVRKAYGEPIQSIQKGLTRYQINNNQEQDTFKLDGNYITFFYDEHRNEQIAAIQIISEEMEKQKEAFFAEPSDQLRQGLEYQLFDLTNAARAKFEQPILDWHDPAQSTALNHSQDMAEQNYFSHTNPEGESPFDRLEADGVQFRMAGENLAAGQPSSIYAHQGLMNSKGHRKNILHDDFRLMAVGVALQDDGQPFYTETYLTQ
ncbi:CAP domain-containing protein [Lentibacillus salicampi]|uniref:Serine protease n=1 Tax=Lentibacillus salicampi TaxID=175306 RepID=A0A4Y9ADM1_9BACI|nr:CAP domain-containing protein [Lentibacillus salicampi]TFJ92494.1 serine protease [Lentibacillus salicampi]